MVDESIIENNQDSATENYQILLEILRNIKEQRSQKDILNTMLSEIGNHCRAAGIVINSDSKSLWLGPGFAEPKSFGTRVPIDVGDDSPIETAALKKQIVVEQYPASSTEEEIYDKTRITPPAAIVFVPMSINGRIQAVLMADTFDDEAPDAALLSIIVGATATMIEQLPMIPVIGFSQFPNLPGQASPEEPNEPIESTEIEAAESKPETTEYVTLGPPPLPDSELEKLETFEIPEEDVEPGLVRVEVRTPPHEAEHDHGAKADRHALAEQQDDRVHRRERERERIGAGQQVRRGEKQEPDPKEQRQRKPQGVHPGEAAAMPEGRLGLGGIGHSRTPQGCRAEGLSVLREPRFRSHHWRVWLIGYFHGKGHGRATSCAQKLRGRPAFEQRADKMAKNTVVYGSNEQFCIAQGVYLFNPQVTFVRCDDNHRYIRRS